MNANKGPRTRQQAVSLRYGELQNAPTVTAKGAGAVAESIIRVAKEHGVFVHESPELVALLMQINIDQEIPESLYAVVAELLAWLYAVDLAAAREDVAPHLHPSSALASLLPPKQDKP